MNALEFFDNLKSTKDISEDMKQYKDNIKALNNADICLKNGFRINENEIDKCLSDTDKKYGLYIRMLNGLRNGLNKAPSYYNLSQSSLEYKINQLIYNTNDIPAYICLRENLNSALKDLLLNNNGSIITDNSIAEVKGTIE